MLSSNGRKTSLPELETVILLKDRAGRHFDTYDQFLEAGSNHAETDLHAMMKSNSPGMVCNLQFTSGTTGTPKAAMLTHLSVPTTPLPRNILTDHSNLVNNGRFVGDRMRLTSRDIICCPPPLFHCFGLVLGLLAVVTHGASIVFPSETFQPSAVLKSVVEEECTGLHGVPAMFSAQLELLKGSSRTDFSSLRTGIAAGSSVPQKMMAELRDTLNMKEVTITYGESDIVCRLQ